MEQGDGGMSSEAWEDMDDWFMVGGRGMLISVTD